MKNLIISSGVIILGINLISMNIDLNKTLYDKWLLKYFADEAACTAGLFVDENYRADGYIKFHREKGEQAMKEVLNFNIKNSNLRDKNYSYELIFDDDKKAEAPSLKVILRCGKLSAESSYEYVY